MVRGANFFTSKSNAVGREFLGEAVRRLRIFLSASISSFLGEISCRMKAKQLTDRELYCEIDVIIPIPMLRTCVARFSQLANGKARLRAPAFGPRYIPRYLPAYLNDPTTQAGTASATMSLIRSIEADPEGTNTS